MGNSTWVTSYATPVSGLNNVRDVAAVGYFANATYGSYVGRNYAMKSDGTVWTWGTNGAATQVAGITGVTMVRSQLYSVVALKSDGTVVFLDGGPVAPFTGITDVKEIAAGLTHYLALKNDGSVWAWGTNFDGELGNGTRSNTETGTPVRVGGLYNVASVGAGYHVSTAVNADGTLWTWGRNWDYELGIGTQTLYEPRPVFPMGFDYRLNPTTDYDNDGLTDAWEINRFSGVYFTDGWPDQDWDGDGTSDRSEFFAATDPGFFDPNVAIDPNDMDADGLTNAQEVSAGTNANNPDTDGDGIFDGAEVVMGRNPLVADSAGDSDGDGIGNLLEALTGTNPANAVNLLVFTRLDP